MIYLRYLSAFLSQTSLEIHVLSQTNFVINHKSCARHETGIKKWIF